MKNRITRCLSLAPLLAAALLGLPFSGFALGTCWLSFTPADDTLKMVISAPYLDTTPYDFSTADNPGLIADKVIAGNSLVPPGTYVGWCVDESAVINAAATTYNVMLFSSCDPNLNSELPAGFAPSCYVGPDVWNEVNYLLNHSAGINFYDKQIAIWELVGGPPTAEDFGPPYNPPVHTNVVNQLVSDAVSKAGSWQPGCGDVIAAIVVIENWPSPIQLTMMELPMPCVPSIGITKQVACLQPGDTCGAFGKTAEGFLGASAPGFCYQLVITNNGTMTLSNFTVLDNLLGNITTNFFPNTNAILLPGGSATAYFKMALTTNTTNTAMVLGQAVLTGTSVSAMDSAVALVDSAAITCNLTLSSSCDQGGNPNGVQLPGCGSPCAVTFTLYVTNTGLATLTGVTIISPALAAQGCTLPAPFNLAPGAVYPFTCTPTITCPGGSETVSVSVMAQVMSDSAHCGVYDLNGQPLTVGSACSGSIICGPELGGISGLVVLHCDITQKDVVGNTGISNVAVILTDANSNTIATTMTDVNGAYSFLNLAPSNYIVMVTPPANYTETYPGGVTDNQIPITLVGCESAIASFGYQYTVLPTITFVPPNQDFGCNPSAGILPTVASVKMQVTASSDLGSVTINVSQALDVTTGCKVTRTFTITASDVCNTSVPGTVSYTWTVDTTPPTIIVPAGLGGNLGCNPTSLPVTLAGVSATDTCSAVTPAITFADVTTGCLTTRTFTITAMDACGNAALPVQVVYTWTIDTTPPVITCPLDTIATVYPPLPAQTGTATATDDCTANPTITYSDSVAPGSCPGSYVVTRTWQAVDACGNMATCPQLITYYGTNSGISGEVVLHCSSTDTDLTGNPGITNVTVTLEDVNSNALATVMTDANGNYAFSNLWAGTYIIQVTTPTNYSQTFPNGETNGQATVTLAGCQQVTGVNFGYADTVAPTITSAPSSAGLGCNPAAATLPSDSSISNMVTATSYFGTPVITVTHIDSTTGCTTTRTFTITASAGCNTSVPTMVVYTWTVDTTPPTINVPGGLGGSLGCNPKSLPTTLAGVTATDTCSTVTPVITFADMTSGCVTTRTLTITAVDACGNAATPATVVYTWTVDTTSPTINVPGGLGGSLGCNPKSLPTTLAGVTATDTCSTVTPAITFADVTSGCVTTRTFTITAVDACGNTATPKTVVYTWTVDTTPPTIIVPGGLGGNLGCNPKSLPTTLAGVTATDTCSAVTPVITFADVTSGCVTTRTFTITAVDACGNTATPKTVVYTWTVDTTPPTIIVPGGLGGNLGCNPKSLPTTLAGVTATDTCSAVTPVITFADVTSGCVTTRTFTITAVDACGNAAVPKTVVYTWNANTVPPMITCPANVVIYTNICPPQVYCTFSKDDWSGPCNGTNVWNNWSWNNSGIWWNNWNSKCQQTNCWASWTNWWGNCGVQTPGTNWCNGWNGDTTATSSWVCWTNWCNSNSGKSWNWNNWNYNNNWNGTCWNGNGGWAPCNGYEPGTILTNCFKSVYGSGYCQVGLPTGGYCLKFSSCSAIKACLGNTGTAGKLNCNATDPTTCSAGVFCAEVLALQLNCDYGDAGNKIGFGERCGDLVYHDSTSPCDGKTVRQILGIANCALGGGDVSGQGCTINGLSGLCDNLNKCFEGGQPSSWCTSHLTPPPFTAPPPSQTGTATATDACDSAPTITYSDVITAGACTGSHIVTRTWKATDACGNSSTCPQEIVVSTCPQLTLGCASGSGQVGVAYSSSLVASGGSAPYTFAIISGSLPGGLTLNKTTGAITGMPTNAGPFTFTAQVTDSMGETAVESGGSCSIVIASACNCTPHDIKCNFNGTPISWQSTPGGCYIWFTCAGTVNGLPSSKCTLHLSSQSITIPATGSSPQCIVPVPDSYVTFDPSVIVATTTFDTANNCWRISLPPSGLAGNVCFGGAAFKVPVTGLPGGIKNVDWNGQFNCDAPGVSVNWQWHAAAYNNFTSDYNAIGCKPCDDNDASSYQNSDLCGSPEGIDSVSGKCWKNFVTGGACGGGGSNCTGSGSSTIQCTPCVCSNGFPQCITCKVSCAPSAKCGGTVTYSCTVSNTGSVCFTGGCKVTSQHCGWQLNCTTPIQPGQSCVLTCQYVVQNGDYPQLNCDASATSYCSSGVGPSCQTSCSTQISRY